MFYSKKSLLEQFILSKCLAWYTVVSRARVPKSLRSSL